MAEVKLRLNLDAGEVELVVDGQVALASGKDVFSNWVEAYNKKHAPVVVDAPIVAAPVPVNAPVEEIVVPVNETVIETPSVETTQTEVVVPKED